MKYKGIIATSLMAAVLLIYASAYVVDETEQVVITRWGKIIGEPATEPGLHFKLPWPDEAIFFPKNILHWDGDPGQIPTMEKTYIWVDVFARWKIIDPIKFITSARDVNNAIDKLNDIIDPAVRNFITSNRLIEMVRKTNRQLDLMEIQSDIPSREGDNTKDPDDYVISIGRQKIAEDILKQAQPKLDKFGIQLVDVKFKHINYVDSVRKSVYNRMIAERNQIAEKFRSEGKGEASKITGQKERDLKEITSDAYRRAQEIMGEADATAARLYAEALGHDADFFSFIKTLEIYSTALEKNSSLILSTDSEFFKYFKGYSDRKD